MEAIKGDSSLTRGQQQYRLRRIRSQRSPREQAELQQSIQQQMECNLRQAASALGMAYVEDQVEYFQAQRSRKTRLPRNKAMYWDGSSFVTVQVETQSEEE